jgi:hypothetical protein
VARYELDGSFSTGVISDSTNTFDAQSSETTPAFVSDSQFGASSNALVLEGTESVTAAGLNAGVLGASDFSVSFCVLAGTEGTGPSFPLYMGGDALADQGVSASFSGDGSPWSFSVSDGTAVESMPVTDGAFLDGAYHCYALTVTRNLNLARTYLDGARVRDGGVALVAFGAGPDLTLGARTGGGQNFLGDLDHVSIWRHALSDDEVFTEHEPVQQGLIARWSFDNGSLHDLSAHNNDLAFNTAGTEFITAGPFVVDAELLGPGHVLTASALTAATLLSGPFTISLCFAPDASNDGVEHDVLTLLDDARSGLAFVVTDLNNGTLAPAVEVRAVGSSTRSDFANVNSGEARCYAMSGAVPGNVELYRDGVAVASLGPNFDARSAGELALGSASTSGVLDEVRIYNRALSATEINAIPRRTP